MKYDYPKYELKSEYSPGQNGWDWYWKPGETACVDRAYYALPDGNEFAIFKFCERTFTGKKKCRWETWWNGKLSNNYFTGWEGAYDWFESYLKFNGLKDRSKYRVYEKP